MSIEKKIEDLRNMTFPVLMKVLQPPQARLQVAVFVDMILRSIFPKPWPNDMNTKLPIGRYSEEKHQKWDTTGLSRFKKHILMSIPSRRSVASQTLVMKPMIR